MKSLKNSNKSMMILLRNWEWYTIAVIGIVSIIFIFIIGRYYQQLVGCPLPSNNTQRPSTIEIPSP